MKLYLVPTPVGNLADMTFRAVDVLQRVDLILAEDTRTSQVLLQHYHIVTPMQSYHIFNEHQTLQRLLDRLLAGQDLALITDAGTPAISDPGFLLVREAIRHHIDVECLPGATAFVPALVSSGLPCDQFSFVGFLPHKKGRQSALQALATLQHTFILYESPFRLVKTLTQLSEVLGCERAACVCREISKVHAENVRGGLGHLATLFGSRDVKGEIVIVVAGAHTHPLASPDDTQP